MLDQYQKSLLTLFDDAPCIRIHSIDLDNRNTILCLDADIDMEKIEFSYWGRWHNDGYKYKLYCV